VLTSSSTMLHVRREAALFILFPGKKKSTDHTD
jgi:hypothetical protein